MANRHVQPGAAIDWINGTGSDVASKEVVPLPDMIGIAAGDIASTEEGVLHLEEVWELPKEAPLVISVGDQVYWDATNDNIDKTDTNVPAGKAVAAAASADTTVMVKINV
jgi:predicted RecA/RadA family phage recombinase